ncbi:MAG: adenylate/guanylate cyclase domain-containing protein [Gammaproteobacteria bacterium]
MLRLQWLAAALLIGLFAVWTVTPWGVAVEESLGLESLFKLRGERPAPAGVIVLAVNRESAAALGLSTKLHEWSRQTHAQAVAALDRLGARLVVFDIFFEQAREPEGDEAFAEALRAADNVILFARSDRRQIDLGELGKAEQHTLQQPYAPFADAARATAPLILPKIPARVSRFFLWHPQLSRHPTLPSMAYQLIDNDVAQSSVWQQHGPGRLYNFYGPPHAIPTISYAQLLTTPDQVAASVRDAVVFVGFSALDQPDQRDGFYTAFTDQSGLDISGVELAATAFANLQDDSWLRPSPWYLNLILSVAYGLGCFVIARRLAPIPGAIAVVVVLVIGSALILYCFSEWFWWLPWFNVVLLQTPLAAGLGIWLRSRELQTQKTVLKSAFGKYLPSDELDRLLQQQALPATREMHDSLCLVTDAEGYSRLSEQLAPVELSGLMQDYYAAVIEPIRQGGGLISDVAGDGVIALWPHIDRDARWTQVAPVVRALLASVDQFNQLHPGRTLPIRIGLHAGEIVLGHFGAADHYEFRAMGDLVNTTARLESANKQIGTRILISEACVNESTADLRDLGRFRFAGKDNPLRLYTLAHDTAFELLERFAVALRLFETGKWWQAAEHFAQLSAAYPDDGPCAFYARHFSESRRRDQLLPSWEQGIACLLKK